jgi:hypothetical protein
MHWIVQDNFYQEPHYDWLLRSLEQCGAPYTIVQVVPFSHQIIPEVIPSCDLVMVYGSTTLCKIAADNNWTPGSFLNENHDFRRWNQGYGAYLLNADAKVCRFADVGAEWDEFFLRPCGDNKSFAGMVTDPTSFAEWRHKVLDLGEGYTTLDGDTLVCYAPVKDIWAEYRFFVIDGKVITWSQYKIGRRVAYNAVVNDDAIEFVQQMADLWVPARGFVLDVALTEDGYRVIEINCLNSAGLYHANAYKIVEAIEGMSW